MERSCDMLFFNCTICALFKRFDIKMRTQQCLRILILSLFQLPTLIIAIWLPKLRQKNGTLECFRWNDSLKNSNLKQRSPNRYLPHFLHKISRSICWESMRRSASKICIILLLRWLFFNFIISYHFTAQI